MAQQLQLSERPLVVADTESVYTSDDPIESLRTILQSEQCRSISYMEAQQIGESLVDFYTVLGASDETAEA